MLNREIHRMLAALELKGTIPDLHVTFVHRKVHGDNIALSILFVSDSTKLRTPNSRKIWEINNRQTLIPISGPNQPLKTSPDVVDNLTIGVYHGTPLWDDEKTLANGKDPFVYIGELREIERDRRERQSYVRDDIESFVECAINRIDNSDNAILLCSCIATLNALLECLNNKNITKFSALCSGTLKDQCYTKELAELKSLTVKILNYSPRLAEFADLVKNEKEKIAEIARVCNPPYSFSSISDLRRFNRNNLDLAICLKRKHKNEHTINNHR